MPILAKMERNTRALVLGMLLAVAVVSLVTMAYPPDALWDESNGHRTLMGRSGNTTLLQMLLKIAGEAAMVWLLPVVGYVGAALAAGVRKRPVGAAGLLWLLWAVSVLGFLALGDWNDMGD